MNKNQPPDDSMPIRLSLASQAANYIRRGLGENRWQGVLPAETELCRDLGVSRGTLRSALAALFAEGLLRPGGRGGRRHSIVAPVGKRRRPPLVLAGNLVRLLSPHPRFIIAGHSQIIFQTISEALGRAGLSFEFHHHPGLLNLRHPDQTLRKLTSQPNTVGWVLYRSTQAVQQWFARAGIPAVVLGGVSPEVALPHAEFDLVAASRHAVGIFASRGYRRMVFLSVEKATAGDLASADAFVAAAAATGATAEVALFDDTVPGLCRVLDGLLLERPAPTAYLVAFANHVHATIGHLTRRGYPVPTVAAVISCRDTVVLAESIPTIARYQMDAERLGRGAARLMLQALNPAAKTIGQCIVMPAFVDGETAGGRATG
ncbi:MAG: substrate-binding domain-containing protein [Verrucomicrobia bacterium]|nr:substrate-binding domain-containing protein [Verrucomicrobiota bacterium]